MGIGLQRSSRLRPSPLRGLVGLATHLTSSGRKDGTWSTGRRRSAHRRRSTSTCGLRRTRASRPWPNAGRLQEKSSSASARPPGGAHTPRKASMRSNARTRVTRPTGTHEPLPASRCGWPWSSPTARSRRAGTPGSSERSASWTANRSLSNRAGSNSHSSGLRSSEAGSRKQRSTRPRDKTSVAASPTATSKRSHSCSKARASSSSRKWSGACRWWMRARWRRSVATSRPT